MAKKRPGVELPQQAAVQAPAPDAWTPPAQIHEAAKDSKAPHDVLHNLATHMVAHPSDENHADVIKDLAENTSTQPHTLSLLHGHIKSAGVDGGRHDDDLAEKIAIHPNAPAALLEQHIKDVREKLDGSEGSGNYYTHRNNLNTALLAASKKPGTDENLLRDEVSKYINESRDESGSYAPLAHIDPSHYLQLLATRPEMHPEAEHLTPEEKLHNSKVKRLDRMALENLAQSERHTPETLAATAAIFSDQPKYGQNHFDEAKKQFVESQPNIPTDNLDRLYNSEASDWTQRDTNRKILAHKNVNPTLLASVARNRDSDDWQAREAAFENPRLPQEIIRSVVDSPEPDQDDIQLLSRNSSVHPDDMRKMYDKSDDRRKDYIAVMDHAPDDLKTKHWDSSNKSTEAARHMLTAKNLPPKILKDIVNHKNQNVALEAIKHPSANEEVLETAVKRKAPAVADAAARHPLLAGKYFDQRVKEGKMKGSELLFNKSNFSAVPPEKMSEYIQLLSHRYKDPNEVNVKGLKENNEDFYKVKAALAEAPQLSPKERDEHMNDVAREYSKVIPANYDNWRLRGDDHPSQMAKSVIAAAKRGHKGAEDAILATPKMLAAAELSEGHDPKFLSRAYESVNPSEDHATVRDIASNPRTPEKTFDKIIKDRNFFDSDSSYVTSSNRGEVSTVFDDRWKDAPDKDAKFRALAQDPEAYKAVVRSSDAPEDAWRHAFENMDETDRDAYLAEHPGHAVDKADDEVYTRMLNGEYNGEIAQGRYGRQHNDVQVEALKQAGEEYAGDIINYLHNSARPETPDNVKVTPEQFATKLNPELYDSPKFKEIADAALTTHPGIGAALLAQKIQKSDVAERNAVPGKEKFSQYLGQLMNDATEGMTPEQKRLAQTDRVMDMLEQYRQNKGYGSDNPVRRLMGDAEIKESGSLDFLADNTLAADPEINDHMLQMAMREGLISDGKISEIMNRSPAAFEESLRALQPMERAERIRQTLSTGQVHPELLDSIVKNMNNATFNPAYKGWHGRGDTTPEHVTTAAQTAMDFGRALAQAGQFGNVGVAAAKILKSEIDANRGGMAKSDRLKVMKALQAGAESANPEAKGQIAAWIYKTAGQMGVGDQLPASMISSVIKAASANNDIDALMQLADVEKPHPSIATAITKLVDKPEILDDQKMMKVTGLLDKIPMNGRSVRKIADAYLSRPALATPAAKSYLYNGLYDMLRSNKYKKTSDPESVESETVRAASKSLDAPAAQSCLLHLTKSEYHENAKSAFLALPPVTSELGGGQDHPERVTLSSEVANDPKVMQAGAAGWKLGALARSVDGLNKENRSILVDRLTTYAGTDMGIERPEAFTRAALADGTSGEDCTKLYRSMQPNEKAEFMEKLSEAAGAQTNWSEWNASGVSEIMPHVAADLREDIDKAQGKDIGGVQDLIRIGSNVESAGRIAYSLANKSEQMKSKDASASLSGYAADIADLGGQLMDKIEKASATDPEFYAPSGATAAHGVLKSLAHLSEISKHNGISSKKLLDTAARARSFHETAMKHRDENVTRTLNSFAAKWMDNASIPGEDWGESFKKMPELQFYFGNRPDIDGAMCKGLNIEQMMKTDPEATFEQASSAMTNVKADESPQVVPEILDRLNDHFGVSKESEAQFKRNYAQIVNAAVDRHPSAFPAKYLRDVLGREGIADDQRNQIEGLAYGSGAGGEEFFGQGMKEMKKHSEKKDSYAMDVAINLASSPFLKEDNAKPFFDLMQSKNMPTGKKADLAEKILDNQRIPEPVVSGMYDAITKSWAEGDVDDRTRKKVVEKTIKHKNLPRDTFYKLYNDTKDLYPQKIEIGKAFNPALVNPRFGGDLFRSLPLSVPKNVPNVDQNKLVTKAIHGAKADKIRQVLQHVPAEGITWPMFKKAAPRLENVPEIKQMFMAKNNKPIMPEDVVNEMKKHEPDEYHVTYTSWNGMQRHRNNGPPNLVMQLNTSASMEQKLNQDPKLWGFFQYIQKSANHVHNDQIGGHPVTPHIASWCRIDTSGNKDGWVIEEFQSDFSAKLRKQLGHVFRDRSTIDIDGQKYTQEEANAMVKHIEKVFSTWVEASYQGVEELAKKHGVKRLFVHGQGVRRKMSGIDDDKHVEVFDEAYERQPQKRGFKACQYTDYPNYDKAMTEKVTSKKSPDDKDDALKCWVKELT